MKQSKFQSFIEAMYNTFVGFMISFIVGMIVYPLYGMTVTTSQNAQIVAIFTITSLLRNYIVRRWFNKNK